jgi:hypothetical protein
MEQNIDSNNLSREFNIAWEWTFSDGKWLLDLYDLVTDKCSKFHNELYPDDEIPYDEELFIGLITMLVWKRIINSRTQYPIENEENGEIEHQYYFLYLELDPNPNHSIEISDPIIKKLPKVKSLNVERVADVIDDILKPTKHIIQAFRKEKIDSDIMVFRLSNAIEELRLINQKSQFQKPVLVKEDRKLKVGKPSKFKDVLELRNAVKNIPNYHNLNQTQLAKKLGFNGESGLREAIKRFKISFNELISQ